MFESAVVGDRVWSMLNGWGTILYFGEKLNWFAVGFDDERNREEDTQYYLDGKRSVDDICPTLFWSEVQITIPSKPKKKVKKTIDIWINYYYIDNSYCVHSTKEKAEHLFSCTNENGNLKAVPATLTYETEE